jgi:hypothetical protein
LSDLEAICSKNVERSWEGKETEGNRRKKDRKTERQKHRNANPVCLMKRLPRIQFFRAAAAVAA